ncbi:SRPBCC family protein [Phenylobacterium aquaticum]|uniref:SRPBCC family protein n=1 Tax=Phenylobacterium aquaticum TaxID=1763816 RepID=UPI001F5D6FC7|nr:SRPBCC family protein [Phenylobacterium aquaticum]MCI3132759.1 SRPBCC family protein [Phenylobacterium aquaticum]
MLKLILLAAIVGIAALLAFAATRPNSFKYQRSIVIHAPPEKVFAKIDNFHAWADWSPYEKLDPGMARTYSGPESGVGAAYGWESKGKAGVGSMDITAVKPASRIVIRLVFTKPFAAHNTATFELTPEADGTRVTWAMEGANPFMAKLMGLVFNMDKMVGADFETGLASLKALCEA